MYYVYILFSKKDLGLYIGYTKDLKRRLLEHTEGKSISTRNRLPIILIHYEAFRNNVDAHSRERHLKSGFGREQLKAQLKSLFSDLKPR